MGAEQVSVCVRKGDYGHVVCSIVFCRGVDGNSLFDDMPLCMKAEVYLNVAQDLLEKVK